MSQERKEAYSALMKPRTVLLVEDNPRDAELIELELQKNNIFTKLASNAKDALDLLELYPDKFDNVLVDLGLPGMSGAEFIKICKARFKKLAFVIVSGGHDLDNIATELGGIMAFTKPLTQEHVEILSRL